jgi:exonuclease III
VRRQGTVTVLNVYTPTEDTIDDVKSNFYEELERVIDKFPKYHKKILLGDFNVKVLVYKEDSLKPKIENESYKKLI